MARAAVIVSLSGLRKTLGRDTKINAELKAPFPYFGGKRQAAPLIWGALGDPSGYVEPFAGSAAVLLARPEFTGRRVETLNDADGWLVNAWRAIKYAPDEVAKHADGPVTEIDYHARLAWLQGRRDDNLVSWLEGDPEVYDPKAAGWWLYVMACGIGDLWSSGPWRVIDGRLVDARDLPNVDADGKGITRRLPHLGDAGKGIKRQLPHLASAGKGINRALSDYGDSTNDPLTEYMRHIADRLAEVRIACGDWRRVCGPAPAQAKTGDGDGSLAVFLDPPYATYGDMYAIGDSAANISADVAKWAADNDSQYRIVLCGYEAEHDWLLDRGWTRIEGKSGNGNGYGRTPGGGRRERLWLSPQCITFHQPSLEDALADFSGGA